MRTLLIAIVGLVVAGGSGTASAVVTCIPNEGGPLGSQTCLINNGLAPPNPDNVLEGSPSGEADTYVVRNVGCPPGWPTSGGVLDDCLSPGAPTAVEVWVSFGDVLGLVVVSDSSSVALTRGDNSPGVHSWGSSTVTKTGGWSGSLVAYDSSTITMSGGTVPSLNADEFSTVTMSGGTADYLLAYGSSAIRVAGGDFAVDGVPVPYGNLTALTGTLTGTLASGDPIDAGVRQGGGSFTGTITLVRAPDTVPTLSEWGLITFGMLLLTAMAVALRRQRSA